MTENIEQRIGDELRERGWRLAVAESCTGGLIGDRITNNSGSSTYYLGSITAYAYRAKVRLPPHSSLHEMTESVLDAPRWSSPSRGAEPVPGHL